MDRIIYAIGRFFLIAFATVAGALDWVIRLMWKK